MGEELAVAVLLIVAGFALLRLLLFVIEAVSLPWLGALALCVAFGWAMSVSRGAEELPYHLRDGPRDRRV